MPPEKHENIVNDREHFFFMLMGYLFLEFNTDYYQFFASLSSPQHISL